ncbi:MAG TPA: leucyl/phenylalanyl-tRNA--protein transferase [Oceanospirillales bacterium]|nr:leucyl/phenylalanyl-tRNA--protein transferase [Oleispira sp.]HCM05987.1 leucyl/phenylalanyl-tRNA--protein transferase [Oceanospirillales bacterium]|tara:strand:+ start:863 stop:1558 length:696 start_codon:yes stop_codon:yes gene_type:complete
MIDWLQEDAPPYFPNTKLAQEEPNGLLAAGGLLSPAWLVTAYRQGIFPWYDDESPILWWSPAPRMILKVEDFHIGRSLRKLMRKSSYKISCNLAFEEVIFQCAQPRGDDEGTWITEEMEQAYIRLNANGISHSVECWDESGSLVGGLYGILINRVFYGESMFSRASNASKLAFAYFAQYLFQSGVKMIDCQMHSDHMAQFGAAEVEREEFELELENALASYIKITPPTFIN